jgi:hypothetical protein
LDVVVNNTCQALAMLNLFSLKNQDQNDAGAGAGSGSKKKASAAQLRITKDINELELPKTCKTEFPDPDDLLTFKLLISPDEGFYRGGRFVFSFKIGPNYPHEPPKVMSDTSSKIMISLIVQVSLLEKLLAKPSMFDFRRSALFHTSLYMTFV